jgi:hypothetical protein
MGNDKVHNLPRRDVRSHGVVPLQAHDTRADMTIAPSRQQAGEHAKVMVTEQLSSHLRVDEEVPGELHEIVRRIS